MMDIRIMNCLGVHLELYHCQPHLSTIHSIILTIKGISDPQIWFQIQQCTTINHFSNINNQHTESKINLLQHKKVAKRTKEHDKYPDLNLI